MVVAVECALLALALIWAWRRRRPGDAGRLAGFVALFALRVAVMLPLYLAGEVALLGVAKIGLGWPAYLLAVVVMGWLLATGRTPQTDDGTGARTTPGALP